MMYGLDLNVGVAGTRGHSGGAAVPDGFLEQNARRGQVIGEGIHRHVALPEAGGPESLGEPLDTFVLYRLIDGTSSGMAEKPP